MHLIFSPCFVAQAHNSSFCSGIHMKYGALPLSILPAYAEWGHDFRPDYRQLGVLRDGMADCEKMGLPRVPIMALTATATHRVREEIMGALKLKHASTKVRGNCEHQHAVGSRVYHIIRHSNITICACLFSLLRDYLLARAQHTKPLVHMQTRSHSSDHGDY